VDDESPNDLRERVEELLAHAHAKNSEAPTKYADQAGAFEESIIDAFFGEAFPIVPDANVLRGNIAHMCRTGRRPVLLTGANTGTFRLYCAEHVLDEVREHAEEWASDLKIACDTYIKCWERHFLPNLRLVRTTALRRLLSPEERARIDALPDRDDVPSAMSVTA
jgi:predicted nucleic acid-binding protein